MAQQKEYIDEILPKVNQELSELFEEIFTMGVRKGSEVANQIANNGLDLLTDDELQLLTLYRGCSTDGKQILLSNAQHYTETNVIYLKRESGKIVADVKGK